MPILGAEYAKAYLLYHTSKQEKSLCDLFRWISTVLYRGKGKNASNDLPGAIVVDQTNASWLL